MWPALKEKNGKISIGRHTSRFKIVTSLRGHSRESILVIGTIDPGQRSFINKTILEREDPLPIRWGFSLMCVGA